jgi:hypothetical protein
LDEFTQKASVRPPDVWQSVSEEEKREVASEADSRPLPREAPVASQPSGRKRKIEGHYDGEWANRRNLLKPDRLAASGNDTFPRLDPHQPYS